MLQKNDSLHVLAESYARDTNEINVLISLAKIYLNTNPDSSFIFSNEAFSIAEKWKINKKICSSYLYMGNACGIMGNYPVASEYFLKSLSICEKTGDKTGQERMLGGMGVIYKLQGDYNKALENYRHAMEIAEAINDSAEMGIHCGNIGVLYKTMGEQPGISEHSKDSLFDLALKYDLRALEIAKKIKAKNTVSSCVSNIGKLYERKGDFSKALEYDLLAMKLDRENGNKTGTSITYLNIGELFIDHPTLPPPPGEKLKGYALAQNYVEEALAIAQQTHEKDSEMKCELSLSNLFEKTGKAESALQHYRNAMVLKDTLFNLEKNKQITQKQMTYEFEKKQGEQKAEQEKKDAVAKAESRRQRIILFFVGGVLILALIFASLILRSLRITRRQKKIIEIKNRETELQKILLEEKQKEIIDSIHYAKRIQESLMPTERYIDKNLKRLKFKKP